MNWYEIIFKSYRFILLLFSITLYFTKFALVLMLIWIFKLLFLKTKIMPTITEWLTIYKTDYCTSFTWDTCVEWTSIQSLSTQDIKRYE